MGTIDCVSAIGDRFRRAMESSRHRLLRGGLPSQATPVDFSDGPHRYRYSNLSAAIRDKNCPLRCYYDERFPHRNVVQENYRNLSGQLVVDRGTAAPGTVGAAFDFMIRATLDGSYVPEVATRWFRPNPNHVMAIEAVAEAAGGAAQVPDVGLLARACWALALCTEVYRSPAVLLGGSPLVPLLVHGGSFDSESLLNIAKDDAVIELRRLYELALDRIGVLLQSEQGILCPEFDGSARCKADADLITDGVLVELKVKMGNRPSRRTGLRKDGLTLVEIYQLIGYPLFDTRDLYGIRAVATYSARYGVLHRWPLQGLLDTLAGEEIDLAAERARVWRLLNT